MHLHIKYLIIDAKPHINLSILWLIHIQDNITFIIESLFHKTILDLTVGLPMSIGYDFTY